MSKKNYKKSRKYKKMRRRKIIFGIEITVLLILSGILFVYAWINRSMDKMNQDTLDSSQIQINSEVKANTDLSQMSGTQVIALVGVDARGVKGSELAESMNSDTIILCCIDHDKQEIRMVSIMRDTWMNMAKYTDEYYEFDKANSAYNRGGPESMLSMLNTNLDFALTDYVTVNFKALADAIDVLGGLDIEMTNAECVHANNYNREVSEAQGVEYEAIPYDEDLGDDYSEVRHVSGALATSYARIRYGGGDDAKRTSRQRIVINLMVQKLKQNPTKIPEILDKVMGNVSTSLTKNEILELGMHAVTYTMGTSYAYPFQLCYGENVVNAIGEDVVIPVTLEFNVRELHEYLYPGLSYEPSAAVTEYSDYIARKSGYDEDMIGYVLNQGPGAEADSVIAGD
ncbi:MULTISPECIES: LCP family protein [Lachnospiraceae]|jgi:LCP family protein required for cell wall assembly|uniref:LCP family protein n=1 Tax=Lachnospiraceae TaxID=186803 RepID=UPI000E4FD189|nr:MULTISPECIES: LCP family protein [Lachnospiraceae]RHU18028.1 LytR family transcriptional regulator [Blautia sp. TM10-2]RHV76559.1 LytR family transcriptional regulator [Blautia sp. OF11-22]